MIEFGNSSFFCLSFLLCPFFNKKSKLALLHSLILFRFNSFLTGKSTFIGGDYDTNPAGHCLPFLLMPCRTFRAKIHTAALSDTNLYWLNSCTCSDFSLWFWELKIYQNNLLIIPNISPRYPGRKATFRGGSCFKEFMSWLTSAWVLLPINLGEKWSNSEFWGTEPGKSLI